MIERNDDGWYEMICDECGESADAMPTWREALEQGRREGFLATHDDAFDSWEHTCPACLLEIDDFNWG